MSNNKRVLASIVACGGYALVRIYAEHSADSFELVEWEAAAAEQAAETTDALLARASLSAVKRPSRGRR
jgi:hypothetical protein